LRIFGRIGRCHIERLAGPGAAQGTGESLHRVLSANFHQRIFSTNRGRLGVPFDITRIRDLRPVAVGEPVFLTGSMVARFAQMLDFPTAPRPLDLYRGKSRW
jgi:hypothetical protein